MSTSIEIKKKKKIVAVTADLKILTSDQYRFEVRKSINQYKSGLVVSQKEMKKSF